MPHRYPRPARPLAVRVLAVLALAAGLHAPAAAQANPGGAEILWDRYGVPHIFAADDESLARAFGWAQARNHADLLLQLYGQARGRAAEYWGEQHLESDRWVRTVRVDEWAAETYAAQPPEMRRMMTRSRRGSTPTPARIPKPWVTRWSRCSP